MRLSPRYEGPPVLRLDVGVGAGVADPSVPLVRQRRRLGSLLSGLSEADWAAPSRCDAWSVKDVVAHLVGTNQFWTLSVLGARSGAPTRFLDGFDPVATPAAMVEPTRGAAAGEVLSQYLDSVEQLTAAVDGLSEADWSCLGEAPPGHIELRAVVLHGLWDAWTHERDVLLPLGGEQVIEADEVAGSLAYCAAISAALLAAQGSTRLGTLAVRATDPDVAFVVEAGECVVVRPLDAGADAAADADAELRGGAVELIEGLTFRAPLVHDVPAEHQWLLGGLAQAFDLAG